MRKYFPEDLSGNPSIELMDGLLAEVKERKGALWASLVENLLVVRLANHVQGLNNIMIVAVSKLTLAVLRDKYGDDTDKVMKDLIADVESVTLKLMLDSSLSEEKQHA